MTHGDNGRAIHIQLPRGDLLWRARFKLIPSVLRPDGLLRRFHGYSPTTTADQIRAEAELLRRFFALADQAGLPLPEDSQALRKRIAMCSRSDYPNLLRDSGEIWPPNELLSLLAIAQHYGLPTRLLDWTRSHLTAGYFAAFEAKKDRRDSVGGGLCSEGERRISVWAFEYSRYLIHKSGVAHGRSNEYQLKAPSVELVTAPRAGNPNLHAQDGLFSLFRPGHVNVESEIDRRPLDALIKEESENPPSITLFYEITLPIGHASQLMWLLAREGTTAARYFPGTEA